MDNPAKESNNDLGIDDAGKLFAEILDPQATETQSEAPKKPAPAAKAESALPVAQSTQTEPAPEAKAESDEETVEVEVDGIKVRVPKAAAEKLEAKEKALQADYTRKTMQAAEERKAALAESQKAQAERAAYAQRLHAIHAQLEGALQQQQATDWDALLESDSREYLKQWHLFQKRQAAEKAVSHERQKLFQIEAAQQQHAFAEHLRSQHGELLKALPDWSDSSKANEEKAAIRAYLTSIGYDEGALNQIADHRAVILARKAMLYDQAISKASAAVKKVSTLPSKVERPGVGESPHLDRRTAAYQRLAKTGRVEDAGAVFASLL